MLAVTYFQEVCGKDYHHITSSPCVNNTILELGNHRAGQDSRACAELTLKIFKESRN
jgi:hypothetical protein